jgi:LysR family transcriptional regulator (chromosome initiation inhibitor)
MQIDNAQLTAFAAVLREGTFDLAARKLNVTPSAISQRIKLLEDRIGQILIQRTTPCQATEAGRTLLRYAEEVTLLESEVLSALGVDAGEATRRTRIPIVINADSLDSWFADVLQSVANDESLTLDVRTEDQDHSIALLREGVVMAGVSAIADSIQGCRVEPLGAMRYLAVASPTYMTKYFPSGVNEQSLNFAPMLMFNKKDALQWIFLTQLTKQTILPPIHYVPSTRSFFEAARLGLAWGMMPEQIVSDALRSGTLVDISPKYWLDVPLYWHRWRIGSRSLDLISSIVHNAAKNGLRKIRT